jgi:D-alanyl-D-alanine carboxypeptidase
MKDDIDVLPDRAPVLPSRRRRPAMNLSTRRTLTATVAAVAAAAVVAVWASGAGTEEQVAAPSGTENADDVGATRQQLLDGWAEDGLGGVAVAIADGDEEPHVLAAGTDGPGGGSLTPDAEFRVGSVTKTFVAVMVLQAIDESDIGLDDLVTRHVPDATIASGVTIRQLLAHRSGLPEHADGELGPAVLADPTRTWTPEDVLALVADQPRDFPPGERFAYSNTNYIIAGVLLERLTGQSLADNLRSRITDRLGLDATYFAPDTRREPIGGFSSSLPGGDTEAAPYRAHETAVGAAGALVSSARDLATFLRALAHGELLADDIYAEMVSGLPAEGHSLGVFAADPPSETGISNAGALPGFTAYMQYDPATGDTFVLLLNDDTRSPEHLAEALLAGVA